MADDAFVLAISDQIADVGRAAVILPRLDRRDEGRAATVSEDRRQAAGLGFDTPIKLMLERFVGQVMDNTPQHEGGHRQG
jgi:hypothetical protein